MDQKLIKISQDFTLACSQVGERRIVSVMQTSLPWCPVLETLEGFSKEEGNKNFIYLKNKYSTSLFYS